MVGTIHTVGDLHGMRESLLQDLFEDSSTGSNEAKVRFLCGQVRDVLYILRMNLDLRLG